MPRYLVKRLLLLPITLLCIILFNFVIINLAPGEPVMVTGLSSEVRQAGSTSGEEEKYLQFREFYGLTLPIIVNFWPWTSQQEVLDDLETLVYKKEEISAEKYGKLRVLAGDRARFVLPALLNIMQDQTKQIPVRKIAIITFLRGATRFVHIGPHLSEMQKEENTRIAKDNLFLDEIRGKPFSTEEEINAITTELATWFTARVVEFRAYPTTIQKLGILVGETRFAKYMSRVIFLDFGVLRSDPNRTVISEVMARLKYSLTLTLIPMIITFFLCQFFGLVMAVFKNSKFDRSINLIFLLLYATPVFVVGPFLIEKIALHHNYPFTNEAFPIRGFSSSEAIYTTLTSFERVGDIFRHITLPLLTLLYGGLAVQSRLSRAVILDTLQQDFIRTARAKGVPPLSLYLLHVGKNAAIPIITSIAGSLGLILGGAIIVETIFEIHGFGKFFFDAIVDRDYNVMMFSAIVGSFLALLGYLMADLAYMALDPRIRLEKKIA